MISIKIILSSIQSLFKKWKLKRAAKPPSGYGMGDGEWLLIQN
jgi:hypothetical protein